MRRFSKRNALVTLSDINVTPLLDLAFVLLIIFIIISPSIQPRQEHGITVNLPKGGAPDRNLDPRNILNISVNQQGQYAAENKFMPFDMIQNILVNASQQNPNLIVHLRCDGDAAYKHAVRVMHICQERGILFSPRTQPLQ
jgi:biopolymer transport protein ExbD